MAVGTTVSGKSWRREGRPGISAIQRGLRGPDSRKGRKQVSAASLFPMPNLYYIRVTESIKSIGKMNP